MKKAKHVISEVSPLHVPKVLKESLSGSRHHHHDHHRYSYGARDSHSQDDWDLDQRGGVEESPHVSFDDGRPERHGRHKRSASLTVRGSRTEKSEEDRIEELHRLTQERKYEYINLHF